ncbi:sulfite exporter TauE/SafE family protein [Oxalobacteraceae bacterium OM1]|nr:sulfite exporter TauE/SafE family protein [Oxalobacteraceae bacterium OM1]
MNSLTLIPVFLVGLLGSIHCVGMCGGIVGAFSAGRGRMRTIAIAPAGGAAASTVDAASLSYVLAYNTGRLASYATAGAIAGGMAQSLRVISALAPLQLAGYWLANLMLVALGLYLMDVWHGVTRVEAAGKLLWSRLQPLLKHVMPADTPGKVFLLGTLWGWVPCGMVYSVLLTAMMSGSAASGAAVMMAFGLGTLPMLLALGLFGARLKTFASQRPVRVIGGAIVLAFGLLGIFRAATGMPHGWLDAICITPPYATGAWQ